MTDRKSKAEISDKEFWMLIRRGLLMITRAIEIKFMDVDQWVGERDDPTDRINNHSVSETISR
jgi:hypothetical protein